MISILRFIHQKERVPAPSHKILYFEYTDGKIKAVCEWHSAEKLYYLLSEIIHADADVRHSDILARARNERLGEPRYRKCHFYLDGKLIFEMMASDGTQVIDCDQKRYYVYDYFGNDFYLKAAA